MLPTCGYTSGFLLYGQIFDIWKIRKYDSKTTNYFSGKVKDSNVRPPQ